MNTFRHLMAGVGALALSAGMAEAADLDRIVSEPGYAATITSGYVHTFGEIDELDANGVFGEADVLWRPTGMVNVQTGFAYHAHDFDADIGKGGNVTDTPWHSGAILFLRDQNMGLIGVDGTFGGMDVFGFSFADVFRVGGRFEWFANDMLTFGGRAGYYELDLGAGKGNADGLEASAFANFYVTENLMAQAEFNYLDLEGADVWSIGGQVEFLLADFFSGNTSVFAGGRYIEASDDGFSIETGQIFVGVNYYFNTGGSLANHHRTNTLDNTSTLLERVPFTSALGFIP